MSNKIPTNKLVQQINQHTGYISIPKRDLYAIATCNKLNSLDKSILLILMLKVPGVSEKNAYADKELQVETVGFKKIKKALYDNGRGIDVSVGDIKKSLEKLEALEFIENMSDITSSKKYKDKSKSYRFTIFKQHTEYRDDVF